MNVFRFKSAVRRGFTALPLVLVLMMPRAVLAESLADALIGAYQHSGLLEQNRALLRAADEDVAGAQAALKPVLRWAGGLTQNFGTLRNSGIQVGQSTESLTASINLILKMERNVCSSIRVAVGACGPTPVRMPDAENSLVGEKLTEDNLFELGEQLAAACDPVDDVRGSASYRLKLVPNLLIRAVQRAQEYLLKT